MKRMNFFHKLFIHMCIKNVSVKLLWVATKQISMELIKTAGLIMGIRVHHSEPILLASLRMCTSATKCTTSTDSFVCNKIGFLLFASHLRKRNSVGKSHSCRKITKKIQEKRS